MADIIDIPLPNLRPPCPAPVPGLLLTILPPPSMVGAPPLYTTVQCMAGDAIVIGTLTGSMLLSRAAWPPEDLVEVRNPTGALLWKRSA